MKLIIGLGNPGLQYEKTRHNFGAMVLDAWVKDKCVWKHHRTGNSVCSFVFGQKKLILAKPKTFMNESGSAVSAIRAYYKCSVANMIIVYDDLDLPFGALRVATNKSSGGHNGIQSIIERLGSADFVRVRMGIGSATGAAEKYVLQVFTPEEQEKLPELLRTGYFAIESLIINGLEKTASEFN